jgi:hypothetical protein
MNYLEALHCAIENIYERGSNKGNGSEVDLSTNLRYFEKRSSPPGGRGRLVPPAWLHWGRSSGERSPRPAPRPGRGYRGASSPDARRFIRAFQAPEVERRGRLAVILARLPDARGVALAGVEPLFLRGDLRRWSTQHMVAMLTCTPR